MSISLLCVAAVLVAAPPKDIEEKGKISVGVHTVKMNIDTIYRISVEGEGFRPEISIRPGKISPAGQGGGNRELQEMYFLPTETREYRILVGANAIQDDLEATNDYTFKVSAIRIDKTPILKEKKELTDDDPKYANRELVRKDSHYKAFPIKMKAKTFYVIDMVRSGDDEQFDPFLYLEDGDGKIVAFDDDSGGNLNARIVFQPRRAGDYRIIASTLMPATGAFTLTIRTQQAKE